MHDRRAPLLTLPATNLDATTRFYTDQLGCTPLDSAPTWAAWDLYGTHLVTYLVPDLPNTPHPHLDSVSLSVPFCGFYVSMGEWHSIGDGLMAAGLVCILSNDLPGLAGGTRDHQALITFDPAGNALVFLASPSQG